MWWGAGAVVVGGVLAARARGLEATLLSTSHAFHSPLMRPAEAGLLEKARAMPFGPPRRRVLSTVTGRALEPQADLPRLLAEQLTRPVRFAEALAQAEPTPDLWIEVGPGHVLTRLVREAGGAPVVALDVAGPSLRGLLTAAAAAFAAGAPLEPRSLFDDRFTRPFDLAREPRFIANPCESAPETRTPRGDLAQPAADLAPIEVASRPEAQASEDEPEGVAGDALELVRRLVARRAELPLEAVREDSRLLRDLHLNSISVSELVGAAAQELDLPAPAAPLELADASVAEVAATLERLRVATAPELESAQVAPGLDRWVRAFRPGWRIRPAAPARTRPAGRWSIHGDFPGGDEARARVARWPGHGVLVLLPAGEAPEDACARLFDAARALLAEPGAERCFAVWQAETHALGAALARTLRAEDADVGACVVEAPFDRRGLEWLEAEVLAAPAGVVEARYLADGTRCEPTLVPLPIDGPGAPCVSAGELLVASGGGKGIVAECARALAQRTGAALALLGRAEPESDAELRGNLERLRRDGIPHRYLRVDVTDAEALRAALAGAQAELGPAVGLLHGAGLNTPALLRDLDQEALRRTLRPKLAGLRHLLGALDPARLRLLLAFSSVIGRFGLRGEVDYALANAALSRMCEDFRARHPHCRVLALESSVWADVGMGERLGRVEALRRNGITAISPAEGTALVQELAERDPGAVAVVVTGRLGARPPVALEGPELPLLRFVERPLVHYPGIELVADCEISTATDRYLRDHSLDGRPLFPGVAALEAMAQAAMAVSGETRAPVFEHVRFDRALPVDDAHPLTLRVLALVRGKGDVDVAVRSSVTGFQVDHFRCRCRFGAARPTSAPRARPQGAPVLLRPEGDLYGPLFFQEGRFRRVDQYQRLSASHSCARIGARPPDAAFGPFLPQTLALGDLWARDAALHSIQACVPHALLLPVGVDRLAPGDVSGDGPLWAFADEIWSRGDEYCYDLELRDAQGALVERWEGLRLRRVAARERDAWPEALLAPLIEWKLRELIPQTRIRVALERESAQARGNGHANGNGHAHAGAGAGGNGQNGKGHAHAESHANGNGRAGGDSAIRAALGVAAEVRRRWDGKPEVDGALDVSAAHDGGLVFAVAAPQPVACDLEAVAGRSESAWRSLLGQERWSLAGAIAIEAGERVDTAATRVWTALESLKKAALPAETPLVLLPGRGDGWVCLGAPGLTIATGATHVRDGAQALVFSVLARNAHVEA